MFVPRSRSLMALFLIVTTASAACGGTVGEQPGTDEAHSYRVRGVVRAIGDDSLHIRHEAIADFRNPDGVVVGMDVMSMDFVLAPEVTSDDLKPGDKVSFQLLVDWNAERPAVITDLEALAPETPLDF